MPYGHMVSPSTSKSFLWKLLQKTNQIKNVYIWIWATPFYFKICHQEGSRKLGGIGTELNTSAAGLFWW